MCKGVLEHSSPYGMFSVLTSYFKNYDTEAYQHISPYITSVSLAVKVNSAPQCFQILLGMGIVHDELMWQNGQRLVLGG